MNKELELKLVEKYPKILKEYGGDLRQTCMAFGIETSGDGWYNLLDKCMEKLQYFCDLCLKDGREVQVVANQIKEKFSNLCFYTTIYGATDIEQYIIDDIISEAERKSKYTCEITGKDGVMCRRGYWYKTLCYEEARKEGYIACDPEKEKYWQSKDLKNDTGSN
jgi:hypothetical protein